MIKEFVDAWDKNKRNLENWFRETPQNEYDSYELLVKKLFELVINPYLEKNIFSERDVFNIDEMHIIDDGNYQGTQIFFIHSDVYQPSVGDYVYTNNYYGSCSGCDTLLGISMYEEGLPNEQQVKGYMSLCLNLLQECKYLI